MENTLFLYQTGTVVLVHDKMVCAPSEDLDQLGHLPSLIRVFAVHSVGS